MRCVRTLVLTTSVLLIGACTPDRATAPLIHAPGIGPTADIVALSTKTLWNQPGPAYGCLQTNNDGLVADDFVVPAGKTWLISSLHLIGVHLRSPAGPFTIRTDDGGVPGATIATLSLTLVSAPSLEFSIGDFSYRLATPVSLPAGTYWLAMQLGINADDALLNPCIGAWTTITGQIGAELAYTSAGGLPANTWIHLTYPPFSLPPSDLTFSLVGTDESPTTATTNLQSTLDGYNLPSGTSTALNAKLRVALDAIASGDTASACQALRDFMNQVNALAGKKLTSAQAQELIDAATTIRALIGCA